MTNRRFSRRLCVGALLGALTLGPCAAHAQTTTTTFLPTSTTFFSTTSSTFFPTSTPFFSTTSSSTTTTSTSTTTTSTSTTTTSTTVPMGPCSDVPDATPCDDGNPCNGADACRAGVCLPLGAQRPPCYGALV